MEKIENTNAVETVVEALQALFTLNDGKAITIKISHASDENDDDVTITPCKQEDIVVYYLIEGTSHVCYGGDNLACIAKELVNYQKNYAESVDERKDLEVLYNRIKDIKDTTERESAIDFYSDWYKEVYGHRPRYEIGVLRGT